MVLHSIKTTKSNFKLNKGKQLLTGLAMAWLWMRHKIGVERRNTG